MESQNLELNIQLGVAHTCILFIIRHWLMFRLVFVLISISIESCSWTTSVPATLPVFSSLTSTVLSLLMWVEGEILNVV